MGSDLSSKWGRTGFLRISVSHCGCCQFAVQIVAFSFVGQMLIGEPLSIRGFVQLQVGCGPLV